jgi:NAD(P)-dependent dehydrogenase (short-subunit alcohol dehydrogenase family)
VLVDGEDIVLAFPAADHTHKGWRLAVVQQLARDAAPLRVNALSGGDEAAVAAAVAYLASAPGVTGQLLALDGNGAGEVLSP